jgi:hypothetical protein
VGEIFLQAQRTIAGSRSISSGAGIAEPQEKKTTIEKIFRVPYLYTNCRIRPRGYRLTNAATQPTGQATEPRDILGGGICRKNRETGGEREKIECGDLGIILSQN